MLDEQGLFYIKKQAGMRLILGLGLYDFPEDTSQWNDNTEVVSQVVHDEVMEYLAVQPGKAHIYSEVVLDQEWELVRTLCEDLRTIARLYFEGKIKLGVTIR